VAAARRAEPAPSAPTSADAAAGDGDGDGLRSQGRRTRGRLLDAAMTVLADKGYHAARVDDIVKAAQVSHGTFYLYFANKQELLRALASRCAEEMTAVVGGLGAVAPGIDGRRAVRAWLDDFVATYRRYGVVIRAWMEDTLRDREMIALGEHTFGDVTDALVARVREAGAVPAADAELAAIALLALIERHTYYLVSRGVGDDTSLDTVAALVHRGWFGGQPLRN
jgi:AcrR family transcriptional regulator